MVIYNCPIIGDGSNEDSFRPSIADYPDMVGWQFHGEAPDVIQAGDRVEIESVTELQLPPDSDVYIVES